MDCEGEGEGGGGEGRKRKEGEEKLSHTRHLSLACSAVYRKVACSSPARCESFTPPSKTPRTCIHVHYMLFLHV